METPVEEDATAPLATVVGTGDAIATTLVDGTATVTTESLVQVVAVVILITAVEIAVVATETPAVATEMTPTVGAETAVDEARELLWEAEVTGSKEEEEEGGAMVVVLAAVDTCGDGERTNTVAAAVLVLLLADVCEAWDGAGTGAGVT